MNIAAIILAAGFSSRMGEFKPLLPVGGTSAILRTVACAATAAGSVIVVTGYRADDVERVLAGTGAVIARNAAFESGMFSSVVTGLRALPEDTDAFFLFPADCCAVSPDTLRALTAAYSGEVIVPAYNGSRGHPPLIPARHARGLLSHDGDSPQRINDSSGTPADGARGYLKRYPSVLLEVPDGGVLLDMDTPEDYAALLRFLRLPTYPADAYALLEKYGAPRDIIEHGEHVARAAEWIAAGMPDAGIDAALLRSAALLHDIARAEDDHAERGAALLLREGYPDAARLTCSHMDLPEGAGMDEKLIFLADKLCRRGEIVMPGEQLRRARARFADNPGALSAAERRLGRCAELMKEFGVNEGFFDGF